jgi:hypothetical protein
MQDPEIADLGEHAPGLIGSLVSKLEGLYMTLMENNDSAAKKIPGVVKKAREVRDGFVRGASAAGPGPVAGAGAATGASVAATGGSTGAAPTTAQLIKMDAFNNNRGRGGYGSYSGAAAGGYGGHSGATAGGYGGHGGTSAGVYGGNAGAGAGASAYRQW